VDKKIDGVYIADEENSFERKMLRMEERGYSNAHVWR